MLNGFRRFFWAALSRAHDVAAAIVADCEHEIEQMQVASREFIVGAALIAIVLIVVLVGLM